MLDRTIVVLECCAVVGIMLHIEIGDRTTVHREAARIAGRPRIGVYKHVTDRAAVDRSQRAVGIGADPQIGTVLQVLVILIPFSVLVASNAAGLHFKGRAAGHVNAADKVRSLAVRDRRTVDGQLTLITENHAALLIAVNCNIFQRDLAGNVENAAGVVIFADNKVVGSLDRVLALTVDGDVLCKIERGGQLRVLQQRDGLAVLDCRDGVRKGIISAYGVPLCVEDFGNPVLILIDLHAIGAVAVQLRYKAGGAAIFRDRAGERTAGDGDLVACVEDRFGLVLPIVSLDGCVAALRGKRATGDGDVAETLIAGAVDDGDRRAVLNRAVILGLFDRVVGNRDRAARVDAQAARADLHAHGLGVDGGIVDGQRAAAREVDAEAIGNIERAVSQRHAVVRVIAVGLDAARGGRGHFNILEREARVVIGDRAGEAGCRRDQAHELRADNLAILHRQSRIGVVDRKRRAVRVLAGARPGVIVQVDHTGGVAGVKGRAGGVVAQKDDRLAAGSLRLERLVHGVVTGVADLAQVDL